MHLHSSFELHSNKAIPGRENCESFFWYPSVKGTVALFTKDNHSYVNDSIRVAIIYFPIYFLFLCKHHICYSDSCIKFLIFDMTIICVFKLSPSFVSSKHFYGCNSTKTHYNKLLKGNKPSTSLRWFLNSTEFSVRGTLLWRYFIGMIITLVSLANSCFILIFVNPVKLSLKQTNQQCLRNTEQILEKSQGNPSLLLTEFQLSSL